MHKEKFELRLEEDIPAEEKSMWVPVAAQYQSKAAELLSTAKDEPVYGNPSWIKPTRNATCPCGSGKKFKKCCGGVSCT